MKKGSFGLFFSIPMVLVIIFVFILPYGAAFKNAFSIGEEISLWKNTGLLRITFFTVKQALLSVVVSLVLGLPGAFILGSRRSRFTPFLRTYTAIPFAMPSILVVLGFVLFFGNSGWVNHLLGTFSPAGEGPLRILYKPEAIILAHGFFNFPLVIRLAGDGLARAGRTYTDSAANLGASPLEIIFSVILPLVFPSIMSASLLVFLYSFTSFAVVLVLGGGPASTTLSVEIYRHAKIFLNYRNAGMLALVETGIAVLFFAAYFGFVKKSGEIHPEIEEYHEKINDKYIPSRILRILYYLIIAIIVLGPIFSIILESFLYQPSRSASLVFGLRWWFSLSNTCLPALFRSLVLALISATLACILAVLAAGSLIRRTGKTNPLASSLVRFLAAAPIVSSGIVLGLGWLIVYGRNSSLVSLVMLHVVIALPFAFNSIYEGFRSLPANIIDAASVLGSSPGKTILNIALPLSFKRICSAWGFAAALSLGELNTVMMLGMENWETLPLYIYRAAGAYRYGAACAAGTLLLVCCASLFLVSEYMMRNEEALVK